MEKKAILIIVALGAIGFHFMKKVGQKVHEDVIKSSSSDTIREKTATEIQAELVKQQEQNEPKSSYIKPENPYEEAFVEYMKTNSIPIRSIEGKSHLSVIARILSSGDRSIGNQKDVLKGISRYYYKSLKSEIRLFMELKDAEKEKCFKMATTGIQDVALRHCLKDETLVHFQSNQSAEKTYNDIASRCRIEVSKLSGYFKSLHNCHQR